MDGAIWVAEPALLSTRQIRLFVPRGQFHTEARESDSARGRLKGGCSQDWLPHKGCRLLAARELEACDFRAPIERAVGLLIFVRVPECAVVDRINCHRTIVTPAI